MGVGVCNRVSVGGGGVFLLLVVVVFIVVVILVVKVLVDTSIQQNKLGRIFLYIFPQPKMYYYIHHK